MILNRMTSLEITAMNRTCALWLHVYTGRASDRSTERSVLPPDSAQSRKFTVLYASDEVILRKSFPSFLKYGSWSNILMSQFKEENSTRLWITRSNSRSKFIGKSVMNFISYSSFFCIRLPSILFVPEIDAFRRLTPVVSQLLSYVLCEYNIYKHSSLIRNRHYLHM